MTTLPPLTDDEKRALCLRLEGWGLLRRTAQGRLVLTVEGHQVGCMIYAMAILEQSEREAAAHEPNVRPN
jgi:hypothetical protein